MSEDLVAAIKQFEGFRSKPYLCPAGKWTIGYGETGKDIGPTTDPWTEEQADQRLRERLAKLEAEMLKECPMLIGEPQPRIDAVVDFAYNFGAHRIRGSTLSKKIEARDWEQAAVQLRRWVWAVVDGKAKKLPGLVKRRDRAATWMATGKP